MRFRYQVGGGDYTIELEKLDGALRATVDGKLVDIELVIADRAIVCFSVDGHVFVARTAAVGDRRWMHIAGRHYVLDHPTQAGSQFPRPEGPEHGHAGGDIVRSPMPGQVRALHAREGDQVNKGQVLLLLEAMKMEIRIQSPRKGRLKRLLVKAGQSVERDQALFEIE